MATFGVGWRTAGPGSTTLPIASLYATTGVRPRVYEVGVFNTTATAVAIALRRATSVGTVGTGQSEIYESDESQAAIATAVDTHTVAPTLTAGNIRVATLGAAIGSGVIWSFNDPGLYIPQATTSGLCIVPLTGTGQICDVYFSWRE